MRETIFGDAVASLAVIEQLITLYQGCVDTLVICVTRPTQEGSNADGSKDGCLFRGLGCDEALL